MKSSIVGTASQRLPSSRRLRIIQLVCTDAFAGVERYVCLLANGLASLGCAVAVVGGNQERMRQELSGAVESLYPASNVLTAAVRLASLRSVDVVHAHMTAAELPASLLRSLSVNKLVVTRHIAAERGKTRAGHIAAMFIRRHIDSEIAVSNYVAQFCSESAVVITPGVPNQDPELLTIRQQRVIVVQRLEPEKHTQLALRAWASSYLGNEGWVLDILGTGSEEHALQVLAQQLGISSSVQFHGMRSDIPYWMQQASLLIATAPLEPFGLSVVEAMASALPVIASAGGGHLETVGLHDHAALYPPGDHLAASQLLRDLAHDPEVRRRYGEDLQRIQRRYFNDQYHAAIVKNHYETVLGLPNQ